MRLTLWKMRGYWRVCWNLCPECNSDAPEIDHCRCCGGSREFPLSQVTMRRYMEWVNAKQEMPHA